MKIGQRIAIIGSGAVGLYYGTQLALAGVSVSFQVRSNADLIRKEGILIETEKRRGSWHWQRPEVFQLGDSLAPFDWILVALKTTAKDFLIENELYDLLYVEDRPLSIQLPPSVSMKVVEAPEAIKGDTVSNVQKPVTLETGLVVSVPLFIKKGEVVRINTDDVSYAGRA